MIIKDQPATDRRGRRVTLELRPGEKFLVLAPDAYYRLGGQMEDVVPTHVLDDTVRVTWNHFSQKWEDLT